MWQASGVGGELWLIADPVQSEFSLEDCGDGFDWRAIDPSLRFWGVDEFIFWAFENGTWQRQLPLAYHRATGRVAFARCLRGLAVRGSGRLRPLTLAARARHWQLSFQLSGGPPVQTLTPAVAARSEQLNAVVVLRELEDRAEVDGPVLVKLPFASGAFVAVGSSADTATGKRITINEEGVLYESV